MVNFPSHYSHTLAKADDREQLYNDSHAYATARSYGYGGNKAYDAEILAALKPGVAGVPDPSRTGIPKPSSSKGSAPSPVKTIQQDISGLLKPLENQPGFNTPGPAPSSSGTPGIDADCANYGGNFWTFVTFGLNGVACTLSKGIQKGIGGGANSLSTLQHNFEQIGQSFGQFTNKNNDVLVYGVLGLAALMVITSGGSNLVGAIGKSRRKKRLVTF